MSSQQAAEMKPLNVLSLDGGGIRGISELVILDEIMARVNKMYQESHPEEQRPLKPCDVFHLIGGTSTGGLIAILLGRLRTTTKEALKIYNVFAGQIFAKSNKPHFLTTYKPKVFERLIKQIVSEWTDCPRMRDPRNDAVQDGDRSGLAFVCAVSIANQEVPRLFRTYRAPRISQDAGPDCDIWQAARATTAAPKYFPEITIDGSNGPETYADGALGFNNPAKFVLTEATDVFGSDRPFGCLVSIGSGLSPVIHLPRPKGWRKFVPFNAAGLVKNLAAIVTNCEKTHAELAKRFEKFPNSYFRFNLPEGAADVRLDEFEKMDKLAKATAEYLHDAEVSRRVEVLARILMENRPQGIRLGDTCGVAARSVPLSKENTQQMKTRGRSSDDFTGREAILAEVKGFFGRRPGGVASRKECLLYGIGGVGKTEIALKLAEHFEAEDAQDKRFDEVIWVDGRNSFFMEESFLAASRRLLPNTPGDAVQKLLTWLSTTEKEWLLIFDDCSRDNMAFFIPPGNKGNILYTSRHRELTRPVSPQLTRQVPIMDEDEAITFLLRASELELESAELKSYARPIVQELCYLPLAIEQAGRYMGQGNCSIDKFLERFRDHRDNLFLDNVGEEMSKAILAVYTTFDISYKLIEEQELDPSINPNKRIANRSALQILNTFCFFHNEGLMADFVGRAAENKCNRKELVMEYLVADCGDLKSSVPQELLELNRNGKWDSKRFDEGMAILRSYGLVKAGGERGTYSIHSLVFSWIRDRMDKLQRFMYLFTARTLLFDSISFRNTPDHVLHRRKCIPHLEAMLVCFNKFDGYPAVFPESELHEAHEIDKYATILAENRRSIDLVEALRLKSLHIKTAQLGPDSKETLSAMMSLAQTKITRKEYKSAEEYVMSVIEARERLFGLEDLSTCRAKRKLAVIYLHSERYTQAERLTRQIAATVEREHGSNHPLLLDILRTRCQVLWMSGQEAEAVELAERLVNLSVEGLAPGDSGRTGSLSTLAQARHESSDYEQAEELHAKIIKMHEAKYGETSLLALADKVYHAIMLLLHEKVDEGVALCEQVYKALKETAGWNHGVTHQAVRTLLTGYMMQRRFLDVEMLLKECLDIASSIGQRREEEERLLRIISRYLDLTERKGLTYNDYLCKIKGLDGIPEELTARTKEKLLDTGQALTS